MFILVQLSDTVTITPKRFSTNLRKQIKDELNLKFCNRIIPNMGLGIALRAIESVGSPKYVAGTTGMHIKVQFRFIVFRPLEKEVLTGVVQSSDSNGIVVSLGFFEDVYVAKEDMPNPSVYDEEKEVWIWTYDDATNFYIDIGHPIRVRVLRLDFSEPKPLSVRNDDDNNQPPFKVIGSIAGTGLGIVSWWEQSEGVGGGGPNNGEEKKMEEDDDGNAAAAGEMNVEQKIEDDA
mmetsp:Transcript_24970/g.44393  ORF Transcript_24970/g.44393 Transcript_24970/m.44393 type:complete len:234 (-) Transcript_24970:137-838(-)|eukprot:CAMPEP_0197518810 /NCGR_PEP_ID=MMETSP1318-20131121/4056_1 /TAXON_ID=552666 /ORGANISM="Partenskyella glossopodia, Strain RCC365" /LENGTH=233 /DNA_ID=CAMNT_0043069437 /DNA_START=218 /DNA_END=919 /DNA_ORIENTATION=-